MGNRKSWAMLLNPRFTIRFTSPLGSMTDKIITGVDDHGNATVMLNRPEIHNAFDPEMVEALTSTLQRLGKDKAVRAVVLVGAGASFCAGADIRHMKASAGYSRKQNYESAVDS